MSLQENKLVIILADISGYTQFMLENQTSAVHGQLCINSLIESILREVDIPLTLQEIEGDAVFLYAACPGSDEAWREVLDEVSGKLERFFQAFLASTAVASESTPCGCAICRNADELRLKIVAHVGEAVFHEIAGRPQVSGPDIILAHRLLKNSIDSEEYLLLTEPAYSALGEHLSGEFESRKEEYEGFGQVPVRVRFFTDAFDAARDALYEAPEQETRSQVRQYVRWVLTSLYGATIDQLKKPAADFGWLQRAGSLWQLIIFPLRYLYWLHDIPKTVVERGGRRTVWKNRTPDVVESSRAG